MAFEYKLYGKYWDHVGAIIGFKTFDDEEVEGKVASSFISFEQAQLNLSEKLVTIVLNHKK